jgi:quercetin dioxygenase-like cupin family protein
MKTVDWKTQQIKDTPHKVDVRPLYDKPEVQVMHITLQPGEQLKPHLTPVDVFFFVLEGSPDILVGDERKTIPTGILVESPKNIVHCLYNSSDDQARIMVVKAPKPTQNARML